MTTTSTTKGNFLSSPLRGKEGVRSMTKSELAQAAGVSLSTFSRWLHSHDIMLQTLGVRRNAHIINPLAVRWICDQYGIEV